MGKAAELRINEQIRAREVRLIDEDGTQLGIKSIHEAIYFAQSRGKDLLEIAPNSNPPVVKVADYSKYRYERDKKMKQSRKHQKAGQLKEIRLHVRTSEHDLETKINHAKEFLEEKFKVKVTIVFRGREMEHQELGVGILNTIKGVLDSKCTLEQDIQLDLKRMSILVAPKH